ncbi:MAG: DUF4214 domain-containing protein [Opitutaceae bacterium]
MTPSSKAVLLSRILLLGVLAVVAGCTTASPTGPTQTASQPSPPPAMRPARPMVTTPTNAPMAPPYEPQSREVVVLATSAPPPPSREVEVVEAPRPVGSHVIFFSEPNFRGESFIVETGADVENLAQLPRQRGSWGDAISSFRVVGVATVVAYADANFQGPRLEASSSVGDLVVERRAGGPDASWDNVISSIRVFAPQSPQVRVFAPEPEPPPPPRFDRRTAENIVQRAYRDILGRNPDADGLRSYREKLVDQNWSEEDVRNHIRRSNEFRAINPDDVITKAYREVLKREPDPEGLKHYRDLLVNHGWTIPQLRADLLRSDERSDKRIREIVTKAYRDILGRDPDPDGFATYQKAIREKGWGEQQVRDALSRSAEARQRKK